jgi:hypothetical protein
LFKGYNYRARIQHVKPIDLEKTKTYYYGISHKTEKQLSAKCRMAGIAYPHNALAI